MKRIAVLIVAMLTMGSLIIIVPNHVNAVNERHWIPLNQDIKVGLGYPRLDGYIKVNVSDVLYINWTSGTILYTDGSMDITVYPSTPIINCSDAFSGFGSEMGGGGAYRVSYAYGQSSPQSNWLRVGSYDIIDIWIVSPNSVQTLNFSVQREIPDIYEMNTSIADLTTNVSGLWGSYLENLTTTNNILWTHYWSLKELDTQVDGLRNYIINLTNYTEALNVSYQQNLSIIQAYMDFTNASINLINAELILLNENETNNTNTIKSDMNDLRNFTNRANGIMRDVLNVSDNNSNNRDKILNNSIRELQNMTGNLSDRMDNRDLDFINAYDVLENNFNRQLSAHFNMINDLTNWNNANTTKLNKQIADLRQESYDNSILTGMVGIITGIIITTLGIALYHNTQKVKKAMSNPIVDTKRKQRDDGDSEE